MSEPDNPQPVNALANASEAVTSEPVAATPVTEEASETLDQGSSDEGLPEWEPLTPELVEEEAIRGDFMLRWAVVFLALLIGCRQIVESTTLVHVKTGQYLRTHGWLPPNQDVFSSTAADQRWINLSWGWDIVSSGLFAIGNGIGLSLATAIIVAVTWWVLGRVRRTNVPSWWGSILGSMTLLACHTQFSGQPETLTLLGVAVTLWILHSWTTKKNLLWWLPVIFVVWSNLDPRMFFGLAVLLLWGGGEALSHCLGRDVFSNTQRREFWIVTATCVGASLLNPFGWQSLLSPLSLFGTEYPSLRSYAGAFPSWEDVGLFGLFSQSVWEPIRLPTVMGTLVVLLATVSLWLNRRRAHFGDLFLLLGLVGCAVLASHELAVAAIAACVIGTLNAQEWYQSSFRQTYSIETRELLFSRVGRAVTVLAFFMLAIVAVNQQLFGVTGKRVGMGLSHDLSALIESYETAVKDSFDDRPFNLVPRQGDVLIWVNQKPFVDSRATLFASSGNNLLVLHDQTRRSLTSSAGVAATPDKTGTAGSDASWKSVFDKYRITHVMPRLVDALPTTYLKLLSSADWTLNHLGGHCAVFYRRDIPSEEMANYLSSRSADFVKQLREEASVATTRPDWPQAATWYQKYISPPPRQLSNSVREADNLMVHIRNLLEGKLRLDDTTAAAITLIAIRKANVGLGDSTDQSLAYEVLAEAYSFLGLLETGVMRQSGQNFSNSLRFNQALAAFQQATRLQPASYRLRSKFMELLQGQNRIDLALREIQEMDRLTENIDATDEQSENILTRQSQLRERWLSQVDEIREESKKASEGGVSPIQIASEFYRSGFVLEALKTLEGDPLGVKDSPDAQALQGALKFEAGRLEDAFNFFEYESEQNSANWRLPSSWTKLARGDYERALEIWGRQMKASEQENMLPVLLTLPMCQSPFHMARHVPNVWPVHHSQATAEAQFRWKEEEATLLWYTAMCQIEMGRTAIATKTLKGLLEANPETAFRQLIRFYLNLLADEVIDFEPPTEWIPISSEVFVPDDEK